MSVSMSAVADRRGPAPPSGSPSGSPVRVAVAGAGTVGRVHLAALAASQSCAPCAIVDPEPGTDALARELDVPRLDTLAALFDASGRLDGGPVEAVVVATPNALHVEHALACIDAGLPLLLEKPVAPTVAEALALAERADAAGARVLVGHHRAHGPALQAAREIVAAGSLGRLVAVTGSATFMKPRGYFDEAPWRREPGAGPILLNLIHEVHALRMLCGEIVRVQAFASNAVRGHAVEDTVVINLAFRNGALGTFTLSDTAASPRSWEQTSGENPAYASCPDEDCYTLAGTHGSLAIPTMRLTRYAAGTERSWWQPFERSTLDVAPADPIARQIEHFGAVARGRASPRVDLADGIRNLRVTEAVLEAARTGACVEIEAAGPAA